MDHIRYEPKGSRANLSITAEQLRAARALLGLVANRTCEAGRNVSALQSKDVETERGPEVSEEARSATATGAGPSGIEFIDENGGGPGVRLRKRQRLKTSK